MWYYFLNTYVEGFMRTANPKLQIPKIKVSSINRSELTFSVTRVNSMVNSPLELKLGGQSICFGPEFCWPTPEVTLPVFDIQLSSKQRFIVLEELLYPVTRTIKSALDQSFISVLAGFSVSKEEYYSPVLNYIKSVKKGLNSLLDENFSVKSFTPSRYRYFLSVYSNKWLEQEDFLFDPDTVRKSGHYLYEYVSIQDLVPGSPFSWQYAYRRGHYKNSYPALVNGTEFPIPLSRPTGPMQWNLWPYQTQFLKVVKKSEWDYLISCTEGYFLNEIISQQKEMKICILERIKELKSQSKLTVSCKKAVGSIFPGLECLSMTFSTGPSRRILWEMPNKPVWVVDTPKIGALYVFVDKDIAHQWSSYRINFIQARTSAYALIIHKGDWQNKLKKALRELGVI